MKTTLRFTLILVLVLGLCLSLGLAGCRDGSHKHPTVPGESNDQTPNDPGEDNGQPPEDPGEDDGQPPSDPDDEDDDPGVAGILDALFGGGVGIVTTPIDHMAFTMAIQDDGKILVAGGGNSGQGATVVRYNVDGTLDTDFGTGGIAALPGGLNQLSIANGLAIDGDGKIVVAGIGTYNSRFRVAAARLNPDGSLDTSFGSSGFFYSPFYSNGSFGAQGVAIQVDGKIVLVGETSDRFVVVRLNTNGSLDAAGFGGGSGYVTTPIQNHAYARAVAIQDDGKIVVVGHSYRDGAGGWDNYATSVARYNADGSLDTAGFGNPDGYVINAAFGFPHAMALQDGKIVVTGGALVGPNYQFGMLRFNADGSLDSTFGNTGLVTTPVGEAGANAEAFSMALTDDGIVLAGHVSVYPDAWIAVARYTADGGLDTDFGSPEGYVLTEIGISPYPYGLAIDGDGKIVAAGGQGTSNAENPGHYFVARYLP